MSWTAREDAAEAAAVILASDGGFFAGVDPLLGTLVGHEPRTVRDLLAQPIA